MPYVPRSWETIFGMPTELAVPVVHLNGTGKAGLVDLLENAYQAGQKFQDALRMARPHQRDYYPMEGREPELWKDARNHHEDRINRVDEILDELATIINAIQDQGK